MRNDNKLIIHEPKAGKLPGPLRNITGFFSRITQSILDDDSELLERLSLMHLVGWKSFAEYLLGHNSISERQANIFRIKLLTVLLEEYWIHEIRGYHSPLGIEVEPGDLRMAHTVLGFSNTQIFIAEKLATERLKKRGIPLRKRDILASDTEFIE